MCQGFSTVSIVGNEVKIAVNKKGEIDLNERVDSNMEIINMSDKNNMAESRLILEYIINVLIRSLLEK